VSSDQEDPTDRRPRRAGDDPTSPAGQGGGQADPDQVAGVEPGLQGPELARAVLDAAKARRAEQRRSGGRNGGGDPSRRYRKRGYSGPGPDPRDPQPFGKLVEKMIKDRGWQRPAAEATVFGDWEKVVGTDIAAHCRPVKLEDGELTIEAESTAWATQLRLLSGRILAKISAEVRPNPVKKLRVHGPAAPSWRHGRLRVRGPGPGDTYG
jgi:predicted nucleic acid-binding Zn ribbon protein